MARGCGENDSTSGGRNGTEGGNLVELRGQRPVVSHSPPAGTASALRSFVKFAPFDRVSETTGLAETQYPLRGRRTNDRHCRRLPDCRQELCPRDEERYVDPSIEIIRQAILQRRCLEFGYRSLPRLVEPMAVGIGRYGRWQLRAHQIGGKSSSGGVGDGTPKLFEVADMTALTILVQNFEIPSFYTRGDKGLRHIDTEL